jgi:hypothetical protein
VWYSSLVKSNMVSEPEGQSFLLQICCVLPIFLSCYAKDLAAVCWLVVIRFFIERSTCCVLD